MEAEGIAGSSGENAGSASDLSSLTVEGAGVFRLPGELQRLQAQQGFGLPSAPSLLHPDAQALLGPLLRLHPADRDQILRTITQPSFSPHSIPWASADKLHDALDQSSVFLTQDHLPP